MRQPFQIIGEKLDKISGWIMVTLVSIIFVLVGAWAQDINVRVNKVENKVPAIDKQVVRELSDIKVEMSVMNTKIDVILAQHKLGELAKGR